VKYDKSILDSVLGLSCIENYLLYILKSREYNFSLLFYRSFLPFDKIVDEFIQENASYASFYQIERIQEVARKDGVIDFNYIQSDSLAYTDKEDYLTAKIKPEYIQFKYNTSLWRDDHYFLINQIDEFNFAYLNDTPRDSGVISKDELEQNYAGACITITINQLDSFNKKIQALHIKDFLDLINGATKPSTQFNKKINDVQVFRDIMGILRILRKRNMEFCKNYIDTHFMQNYISELDTIYTKIEYMRLRRQSLDEKGEVWLQEINDKDKIIIKKLKYEMEKVEL